jgi:mRNA interferase MazF
VEFGKPRPAVVVQSSLAEPSKTVTFLPITSDLVRAPAIRVPLEPNAENGLRLSSEVMVDLIQTVGKQKVGAVIGVLDSKTMRKIDASMMLYLGLV